MSYRFNVTITRIHSFCAYSWDEAMEEAGSLADGLLDGSTLDAQASYCDLEIQGAQASVTFQVTGIILDVSHGRLFGAQFVKDEEDLAEAASPAIEQALKELLEGSPLGDLRWHFTCGLTEEQPDLDDEECFPFLKEVAA